MVKQLSKKALALMLAIVMIVGAVDLSAFEIVYASEVSDSESGSYDSSDKNVLDELGFDLTAEGSYKRDELNAGLRTINSLQEVVLERFGSNANYRVFDSDVSKGSGLYNLHDENSNSSLAGGMPVAGNYNYSLVSSFDGDGDGKNEYVARVSLSKDEDGGDILLSVYKVPTSELSGAEGYKDVFVNVPIGGHIVTDTEIPQYCYTGLLNVATGDFDGDGIDEVAVYSPNNKNETKSGSVANTLEIKVYDIDVNSNALPAPTQVIDVTAGAYGYAGSEGVSEWRYSYEDGDKQYYSIPYVSMTADDANGDGIDDLLICTSFQEMFRGYGTGKCDTWAEILEPENAFASVFDLYEGGSELKHSVVKRPLVGKTSGGGYVLRGATAIVANVSAPNSREIVFGGNYTKIDYEENINMNKVVNDTRAISRTDDSPRVIAGYTTYADLVGDNTTSASLDYSWETSYGIGYKVYEKNMSDAYEPVAMAGFAPYGTAFEDTIFVEGIFFGTGTGGALEVKYKLTNTDTDKTTSTAGTGNRKRWIASVAVGNVSGSAIGEEAIYINWYIHTRYDGIFAYVLSARGTVNNGRKTYTDVEGKRLNKTDTVYNVYTVDMDNDSSFIKYEEGDTDIYYGDVEVLSILQAAPVWGEFDDMYLNDAETSYAKIKGSAFEETAGASLTAGVVIGLEEKTSFLGLFTVAGIDFEITISGSVGYETSKTTSKEYSTEYTTVGDSDTAVIFTVPYVRYNCETYLPTYSLPTKAEYNAKKAFLAELEANIIEYLDKRAGITGGKYSKPTDGYNDGYTTDVNYANYDYQLGLYQNYIEWLETTEATMAEFDAGGTYEWGQVMPGGWQDYYYCIPQEPILTTVDVSTYDEIAKNTKGLTPIYGNVFDKNYRAGDPSTYPKSTTELNAVGEVLSGQTGEGKETDSGGFVTCSPISSSNSAVSQSISVTKETSEAVTYGASVETSLTNIVGPAKVGAAVTVEAGGSSAWISTVGSEYSGSVPNLPDYADSQYSYGWKLVSYTTSLNGKQIPVVGYLVKMQQTPPPSVPEGITVTELTDKTIKLEWNAGERAAEAYEVYRVTTANNRTYYDLVERVTESVNGTYHCVDDGLGDGLEAKTTYEYVIQAVSNTGVKSIYSDSVLGTTLPADMSIGATLKGLESNAECIAGKNITLSVEIDSELESKYTVRSYNWQVDDGSGWRDLGSDKATYVLKTSTLKNGYQYRCKVEVRVGNVVSGDIYELYSNVVTQNARRATTKVSLKTDGVDGGTANYGAVNESRNFEAIVLPESNMDEAVEGSVTYTVSYESPVATYSLRRSVSSNANVEQTTYEANVTDGVAKVDIPFEKVGKYVITAEYGGSKNCEASKTEEAYEYYVYDDGNSEIDFNNEETTTVEFEEQTYTYTGEQICPKITLTWNETVLVENVDYVLVYGENVNVGKGTLSIIPIGNFAGGKPRIESFDIAKKTAEITISKTAYTVTMGEKGFSLSASTEVGVGLVYSGYDSKIVNVDANGLVTIAGVGTTTITIALKDMENYAVAEKTVQVTVLPRTTKLEAAKTKTTYIVGEKLEVNDLAVILFYEDGTKKTITDYTTDADKINMNTAGDKNLTVSYNGLTATVAIKVNPHIVTFDANGGTNLSKDKITISTHNAQICTLPTVSLGGYVFKGWYTAKTGGVQVTATTNVTKSMTVYAQWEKEPEPKPEPTPEPEPEVTAPGKVKAPSLKSKKSGQITVTYKKVSGANGYQISYSTSKKFSKSATKTVTLTGVSKTLTKLKDGKTYYVKVRAYKLDKKGKKVYGAYSSAKNITLKPGKANAPTLKSKKKGQITISFKKLSNVKGYEISYSTSKKFTKSTTKSCVVTKTSKTLTGLKKGKTYYVKVRAYTLNASGKKVYGAYSTVKKVKVKK